MFEDYDVVKLLVPICVEWEGEEVQLTAGLTGAVLDVSKDNRTYLVDFTDAEGVSIAMVPVVASSLELVWKARTKSYVDAKARKTAS